MAKKKSKDKDNSEETPLDQLMKLTRLMKQENVKVAPKGPPKGANKWRSQNPKFAPPPEKSENTVQAGGMNVDPALKDEYEAWRKEKEEEQKWHREQAERRWAAEKAKKKALEDSY